MSKTSDVENSILLIAAGRCHRTNARLEVAGGAGVGDLNARDVTDVTSHALPSRFFSICEKAEGLCIFFV